MALYDGKRYLQTLYKAVPEAVSETSDMEDRLLETLYRAFSAEEIQQYIEDGTIAKSKTKRYSPIKFPFCTISKVIADTKASPAYIFWGTEELPRPKYTPYDEDIISMCNSCTNEQREKFLAFFGKLYDFSWIDECRSECGGPGERIRALLSHEIPPYQMVRMVRPYDPNKNYTSQMDEKTIRRQTRRLFHNNMVASDFLTDIALFLGVSLHWIGCLDTITLYCDTMESEHLFDIYTIVPQPMQLMFYRVFAAICGRHDVEARILSGEIPAVKRPDFFEVFGAISTKDGE